jgi:hypothetical protein
LIDHPYETKKVKEKLALKKENDTELKDKLNNITDDTRKKIIKEEKKKIKSQVRKEWNTIRNFYQIINNFCIMLSFWSTF